MHHTISVTWFIVSLLGPMPLRAQQFSLFIDGQLTASPYSAAVGTGRIFICKANLEIQRVWGTDVYTDDTPICSAAVHAGVITQAQGGVVRLVIGDGLATYTASTRNGITSLAWTANRRSYTFDGNARGEIDWGTSAAGWPSGFNTSVDIFCPGGSATVVAGVAAIYGTDIYSDTSPICGAALHAGLITMAGGLVHVAGRGSQASFTSTTRNGVTSREYGAWHASFSVSPVAQSLTRSVSVGATTTPTTPPEAPPQRLQEPSASKTATVMSAPTLWGNARNNTNGAIDLSWMPAYGVRAYRLTRVRNTGDPETTVFEGPQSELVTWSGEWTDYWGGTCDVRDLPIPQAYCLYHDTDMTTGTTYSYRLYLLYTNGVISPPSTPVTVKTLKP